MDKGSGKRNKQIEIKQFKGLVTSIDSADLDPSVLEVAENVVFDVEGGARKREGFKIETEERGNVIEYSKTNVLPSQTKIEGIMEPTDLQTGQWASEGNGTIPADINITFFGESGDKILKADSDNLEDITEKIRNNEQADFSSVSPEETNKIEVYISSEPVVVNSINIKATIPQVTEQTTHVISQFFAFISKFSISTNGETFVPDIKLDEYSNTTNSELYVNVYDKSSLYSNNIFKLKNYRKLISFNIEEGIFEVSDEHYHLGDGNFKIFNIMKNKVDLSSVNKSYCIKTSDSATQGLVDIVLYEIQEDKFAKDFHLAEIHSQVGVDVSKKYDFFFKELNVNGTKLTDCFFKITNNTNGEITTTLTSGTTTMNFTHSELLTLLTSNDYEQLFSHDYSVSKISTDVKRHDMFIYINGYKKLLKWKFDGDIMPIKSPVITSYSNQEFMGADSHRQWGRGGIAYQFDSNYVFNNKKDGTKAVINDKHEAIIKQTKMFDLYRTENKASVDSFEIKYPFDTTSVQYVNSIIPISRTDSDGVVKHFVQLLPDGTVIALTTTPDIGCDRNCKRDYGNGWEDLEKHGDINKMISDLETFKNTTRVKDNFNYVLDEVKIISNWDGHDLSAWDQDTYVDFIGLSFNVIYWNNFCEISDVFNEITITHNGKGGDEISKTFFNTNFPNELKVEYTYTRKDDIDDVINLSNLDIISLGSGSEKLIIEELDIHTVKYVADPESFEELSRTNQRIIKDFSDSFENINIELIETRTKEDSDNYYNYTLTIFNSNTNEYYNFFETETDQDGTKRNVLKKSLTIKSPIKLDDVDVAYFNDYIIITTGFKVFVIHLINNQVENKDTREMTNESYALVFGIDEIGEEISFLDYTVAGRNILREDGGIPLNNVYGMGTEVRNIVITDSKKIPVFTINSGTDYKMTSIDFLTKSTSTYSHTWTLEKELADGSWDDRAAYITAIPNQAVDKQETGDITSRNVNVNFVETGKYKIKSTLIETPLGGAPYPAVSKELVITVVKENEDIIDTGTIIKELNSCKYVDVIYNKLIFYGNGTQQIYTSQFDRPFYFTANNIVRASLINNGEDIVAISEFKDVKIIFTESSMMSMTGTGSYITNDPWKILPLDASIGAVSHRAVCPTENTLTFVSRDGIYIINQISVAEQRVELTKISYSINDLSLPYFDVIDKNNETLFKYINVQNLEQRIYYSYPEKKMMLVYDYSLDGIQKGKWSVWKSKEFNFGKLFKVNNENRLYNIDYYNARTVWVKHPKVNSSVDMIDFSEDFYKDGKENVRSLMRTSDSNLGNDWILKTIKRLDIKTRNSLKNSFDYTVRVKDNEILSQEYYVDGIKTDRPVLGQMKLGKTLTAYRPSDNISTKMFLTSKPQRELSIEIENDNNQPFEVTGILLEYFESKNK